MKGLFGNLFDLNGDGELDFLERELEFQHLKDLENGSGRRAFSVDDEDEEEALWDADDLDGLNLDALDRPRRGWDDDDFGLDYDDDIDDFDL